MDFHTFTQTYFQGDEEKALEHLAKESYYCNYTITKSRKNNQETLDSMDETVANRFMEYLNIEIDKNPKIMKNDVRNIVNILRLNISFDELKNTKSNPFGKKIKRNLIKLLISAVGMSGIFYLLWNFANDKNLLYWYGMAETVVLSYFSFELSAEILDYFRWNKAKKHVSEIEELNNKIYDDEYEELI